jgi:hypothetical protein
LHGARCLLLFLMMLCQCGCGGCRKTPEAQEQEKQEQERRQAEERARKKEKEPFEAQQPSAMPSGKSFAGLCKPGHWISQVWPDVRANRGDFQGELRTEIADADNHKVPLLAVPYEMTMERPAALAKEQPKSLETCTWIPPLQAARFVNFKLSAGGGGPVAIEQSMRLWPMPSYRYYFIVLSQVAGRYGYLDKDQKLTSIHPRRSKLDEDAGPKFYEVVSMPASRRPGLPTNALYWTSIAYLLWDDFDPAQLDVDQQRALIDWLHWGGQIILSGPETLERLRNSFLRPYLPATVEKSRSFDAHDLDELNYWDWEPKVGRSPQPVRPWPGAQLKKDPQAEYVPYTGDLLIERQVGRGRVVASAFRLTGPELTGWAGFDCFFNACLLRRPAREFSIDKDSEESRFRWVDGTANSPRLDAAKMTAVRYFVRDSGMEFKDYAAAKKGAAESGDPFVDAAVGDDRSTAEDDNARSQDVGPGLGAWNDFSPVAQAARTALRNAAGIRVPERGFIVWVVVGYLCVLVPANWVVFRLLGRVEWAWIAAPLIAMGCTVVVIQQAQLNIGFARSRNEIAVIEMQPGYSRVHVARYTALYTSLATRYEFRLDDPAGQILPFPQDSSPDQFKPQGWQTNGELFCRRGDDTQLTGFSVGSNVADFVHCEEMADFGGTVALHHDSDGGLRVVNGTTHPLDACRAVRGGKSASADLAIGRLEPGATAALKFTPYSRRGKPAADNPRQGPNPSGELSVAEIADLALDGQELRPDEICLLARVVGDVPGLTVTPVAQQTRQAGLLVAHLDAGRLPPPRADQKEEASKPQDQNLNPKVQSPAIDDSSPKPEAQYPQPEDPFSDDRTH